RTTVAGQATFTLVAPSTTGEAHLSLREYAGITGSVPIITSAATTHVGQFQGVPLVGIHYRAELSGVVQEGETDSEGRFQFFSIGDGISPVTFSIGGVVLGSVTPTTTSGTFILSVHDLVSPSDAETGNKALNIQRFLRTINTSASTTSIVVSAAQRAALTGQTLLLHQRPVADFDAAAQTLINTMIASGALNAGTVLVPVSAVMEQMRQIKMQVDATRIGTLTMDAGASSVLADGQSRVRIQVRATRPNGGNLEGALVQFVTTAGTLGNEENLCAPATVPTLTMDKTTDVNGVAYLFLTPRCQSGTATVTGSVGGMIVSATVRFVSGMASATYSSLVVQPASLPADGQSTATVTVILRDANNNPVADGTPVTVTTDGGRLQGGSTASTISGLATFTLVSGSTPATALVRVTQYDYLMGSVVFTPGVISTTTHHGVFLGSTVVGVHYTAQRDGVTMEGETDAEGRFRFFSTTSGISPVIFSVGGVVLGTVTPRNTAGLYPINVHDLIAPADAEIETKAVNLQRFLTTLNTVPSGTDIVITAAQRSALTTTTADLSQLTVDRFDAEATTLVNTLVAANALPTGTTLVAANTVLTHLRETKSGIDAARVSSLTITAGAESVLADGATRVAIQVQANDLDGNPMSGGLIHLETSAGTFGNEANLCQESTTVTTAVDRITDANGRAVVMLTPRCQTANAVVTATLGGMIVMKTIPFTPGPAVASNSSILVNPTTMPADGRSTATVTVSLRDQYNNPVRDGTPVTLGTDAGSVQGNATVNTVSGRATFTLLAASTSGDAHLSVAQHDFLAATVTMGVVSSTGGKPNALQMSSSQQQIFVRGVGRAENVGISIQVRDDAGDPIQETALNYPVNFNNLRVILRTRPQGGETIAGTGRKSDATSAADVETKISSAISNEILVRTSGGSATISLTSGVRPGIVEFQVDALDVDGTTVLASAVSPLIVIASGPPHAIVLTEAYKDGVVNLSELGSGGVYCQMGAVMVTDRYGNAVPDGTTISLNLIDRILASSTDGVITASSNRLTDSNATFNSDGVDLAGVHRGIQPGDLLLIDQQVEARDRRRFVESVGSATILNTNANYASSMSGVGYTVGASLQGGAIHGYNGQQGCNPGSLTTGVARTTGGVAPIRITYPANRETIQLGCLGYASDGSYSNVDTRFPNRSGQVMVVAAANETNDVQQSGITWISKGKFCYKPISPAELTASATTLNEINNGEIQSFTIEVLDSFWVQVPFQEVECKATILDNQSGSMVIGLHNETAMTDLAGNARFWVTISGGGQTIPDTGNIECKTMKSSVSIGVTVD
ncbi:MAG: hypothetical protein G8237_15025, partial [Magnetococcales bacterium]|nr:hypothetical protein [Magnetococcales bacterium]